MKVTFYSNFLTHHQLPFCLDMVSILGDDFKFVSSMPITEERRKLGFKDLNSSYDFVVRAYEDKEQYTKALELGNESDVVIIGSTGDEFIKERLKADKLTFRYRSRVFLEPPIKTLLNKNLRKTIYERHIKYKNNKNLYLLTSNGYGAKDFNKLGLYKDKVYRWGYFPETNYYNIDDLIDSKEKNEVINILWIARFIPLKHPKVMLRLAKKLKKNNYNFKITMIGNGILLDKIKKEVNDKNLKDCIEIIDGIDSDKVKDYMEKANIFILTSGRQEGFGVVIIEAMNGGCAVVANKNIGSVPFLISNEENGLEYSNFHELYKKVCNVLEDKEKRRKLSINAYNTVIKTWNSKNATKNLIKLFEERLKGQEANIKEGPASKVTK